MCVSAFVQVPFFCMPDLYDSLYKLGYQSDGIMTHYSPVLKSLRALVASDLTVKRVLDVGSSHGGGVKAMWTMGLLASGVDVAPTAIALAESRHGANPSQCVPPCWTATPATRLPFADRAFDALISTDVLEHLEEVDVEQAVAELARVTRAWMLLKISNRHEFANPQSTRAPLGTRNHSTFAAAAKWRFNLSVPRHLHTAVHGQAWWVARFNRAGFRLNATIPVPGWACCAFTMKRDA